MRTETKYITADGREFDEEYAAKAHEATLDLLQNYKMWFNEEMPELFASWLTNHSTKEKLLKVWREIK